MAESKTPETKKVELPNGETIAYFEQGDKSNKPFIFLHGNNASKNSYIDFFPIFSKKYYCIAPDMRGFGDSSYNKSWDTIDEIADDLHLFVEKLGLKDFILWGWSLGGAFASCFAVKYPEKLSHLILHCACPIVGYSIYAIEDGKPNLEKRVTKREDLKQHMAYTARQKQLEDNDFEGWYAYLDAVVCCGNYKISKEDAKVLWEDNVKCACFLDTLVAVAGKFNLSDKHNGVIEGNGKAKDIKTKTLIIAGKKDPFCPIKEQEEMKECMGEKAKLVVIEKGGHAAFWDEHEEVMNAINEFLK